MTRRGLFRGLFGAVAAAVCGVPKAATATRPYADGIVVFMPTGITKLEADWQFANEADPTVQRFSWDLATGDVSTSTYWHGVLNVSRRG